MDYGHHDPIHSHRVYRFQAVERALQPLCDDDGKPGDDDGNPYMTGLDLSGGEERSRAFEPCLSLPRDLSGIPTEAEGRARPGQTGKQYYHGTVDENGAKNPI